MSGGTVWQRIWAGGSSVIEIIGSDFMVDGVPVPYGDLTAQTGTLTGTLASGDAIDNTFFQGGYQGEASGTISLLPRSLNTPTLSPWSQLALMVGLLGAGLGVWRRRRG